MVYIVSILSFILALTARYIDKTFFNPVTLLCGMWGIIVFLSKLQLYKLNSTSNEIYFIILVGLLSFYFGYYFLRFVKVRLHIGDFEKNYYNITLRYQLLIIVGILIFLFQLPNLISAIKILILGGGLSNIRGVAQDSSSVLNSTSQWKSAINILFISPFCNTLVFVSGVDFWLGKRNKILFYITLLITLTSLVSNGGRSAFINLIFSFVISFIILQLKSRERIELEFLKKAIKKNKKIFSIVIILAIIIIVLATISRNGDDNSLALLYYYSSMEPTMLESWIKIVEESNIIGYGLASLNGFIFPIIYIVVNILGVSYPVGWKRIYDLTLLTDSNWIRIAGGRTANAYVSIFWFFYFDGGIIGVILGMLIYGMVMGGVAKNALFRTDSTIKDYCIYISLMIGLFYSFARIQFTSVYYALSILYLLLFCFKRKAK